MFTIVALFAVLNCPTAEVPFDAICLDPCRPAGPGQWADSPTRCMHKIHIWLNQMREKLEDARLIPGCRWNAIEQIHQTHVRANTYYSACPDCFADDLPDDNLMTAQLDMWASYLKMQRWVLDEANISDSERLDELVELNTKHLEMTHHFREVWEAKPGVDSTHFLGMKIFDYQVESFEWEARMLTSIAADLNPQ